MMNISDDTPSTNADFESTYGFPNGGINGTSLFTYRLGLDLVIDDLSDIKYNLRNLFIKITNCLDIKCIY